MNRVGKKILTGAIVAGMAVSTMQLPVLAAEGDSTTGQESGATTGQTTGKLTADGTISVTGVTSGDNAVYYQIIKRNETTGAWELNGSYGSLTIENLTDDDGISAEEAHTISEYLTGSGTSMDAADNGTTLSAQVAPGTYMVVITPGKDNAGVVYSPVVVSSDYDADNETNTQSAVAKKTDINVEKTAKKVKGVSDDAKDVEVGDVVEYTLTPVIPLFPKNYTNPVYKVTDTLSTGLELADTTGDGAVTKADITVSGTGIGESNYTVTVNADNSGFTVEFTEDYLKNLTTAPTGVTITYQAKVTSKAVNAVNEMTNKAEINFSNSPSDKTGKGTASDQTNHYTFTLDGNLNGSWTEADQIVNKELIKTAVGTDGKPVLDTTYKYTTSTETKEASPLAGATFKLTGGKLGDEGKTCETNKYGYITFAGLDAGVEYTLTEVSAPTGYVKDSKEHKVKFEATYEKDANGNEILKSYRVLIDDEEAASFTVNNAGTGNIKLTEGSTTFKTSLLNNVKAAGLPSTGGMGTTIFYVIGIILVAGASILLVTKRRMHGRQ